MPRQLLLIAMLWACLGWHALATTPIRLIFVDPAGTSFEVGALKFKSELERMSHGSLQVEVLPGGMWRGQHLDELQILERVRSGSPEMCLLTTAPLGNYSQTLEVLDTPFLFKNYEQVDRVLDGPAGDYMLTTLKGSGLLGLAFMDSGFRIFTSSRPLAHFTDFKNLRVRVMQNAVYYNFIKLLGATPVPTPVDKIYEMAKRGYIDAADRSYPTFWEYRLYEVQKYILESNHSYAAKAMVVNQAFFDRLSPDEQRMVREAAVTARNVQRQSFRKDLAQTKANCTRAGLHIEYLSEEDRRHMRELCQPIYDKAEIQVGPKLMKELAGP